MKKTISLLVLAATSLALSSCNTFIGMGRDFKSLGTGMENQGNTGTWDGSGTRPAPAPAQ